MLNIEYCFFAQTSQVQQILFIVTVGHGEILKILDSIAGMVVGLVFHGGRESTYTQ